MRRRMKLSRRPQVTCRAGMWKSQQDLLSGVQRQPSGSTCEKSSLLARFPILYVLYPTKVNDHVSKGLTEQAHGMDTIQDGRRQGWT